MAELELTTDATISSGQEIDVTINESTSAATDSFAEISESPNLRAHQGYTTDGSYQYSFDTEHIYKWDGSWNLVAENPSPLSDLPAEVNHLGDGDYHAPEDEIHTPAVFWGTSTDNGSPHVSVYDANDLSYKRSYTLDSGSSGGASGVWVDDGNDVAWVSDFLDSETPLYKYDLSDYSLVGSLSTTSGVPQAQGVFYRNGFFYLPSHDTHTTHILDESGSTQQEVAHHSGGAYEGVDYSGEEFRVLHDPNGNSEGHVHVYDQKTTVSNAATQTIENGRNTYTLGGFDAVGTEVWAEADIRSSDDSTTPRLNRLSVRSPSSPENAAVSVDKNARNGVSRVIRRYNKTTTGTLP